MNTEPRTLQSAEIHLLYETLRKAEERATAGLLALEVMHEIRNPLEAVGNLTYLTARVAEDPEKVRSYMHLADEQMSTIRRIANQTLAFARSSPEPEPVDLSQIAEAALRIHQCAVNAKCLQIVKLIPETVAIKVHTGEILQVFSNILMNAIDALPNGGKICLRIKRSATMVRILVVDTGHGIAREHLPGIFQAFFTTKGQKGNGLGLAISQNIIERHNGRIQVRSSTRPGHSGTSFRISLPG